MTKSHCDKHSIRNMYGITNKRQQNPTVTNTVSAICTVLHSIVATYAYNKITALCIIRLFNSGGRLGGNFSSIEDQDKVTVNDLKNLYMLRRQQVMPKRDTRTDRLLKSVLTVLYVFANERMRKLREQRKCTLFSCGSQGCSFVKTCSVLKN